MFARGRRRRKKGELTKSICWSIILMAVHNLTDEPKLVDAITLMHHMTFNNHMLRLSTYVVVGDGWPEVPLRQISNPQCTARPPRSLLQSLSLIEGDTRPRRRLCSRACCLQCLILIGPLQRVPEVSWKGFVGLPIARNTG